MLVVIQMFVEFMQMPQSYKPLLNILINFEVQKALAKYLDGLDACYWLEKGWDKKPYYFQCRFNKPKCFISTTFGTILQHGMTRGQTKPPEK